jgi:hypothetical protein
MEVAGGFGAYNWICTVHEPEIGIHYIARSFPFWHTGDEP